MKTEILQILFTDPQDQTPACYCRRCGGARYAPSLTCIRCGRDKP